MNIVLLMTVVHCTNHCIKSYIHQLAFYFLKVVALSCSDDDASDTLAYSFGATNSAGKFSIDVNGQITLAASK